MNDWRDILDQGRLLVEQHVPTDALPPAVPAAVLVLLLGVGISVLGARLARPVLTTVFGVAGAFLAGRYAWGLDVPTILPVVIAAVVVGGIGYLLYRLWIGVAASVVLVLVAWSIFGYCRIWPEAVSYNETNPIVAPISAGAEFTLPDAVQQQKYNNAKPDEWARDFWAHLTGRQADVQTTVIAIGAAAALVGLLLGVLATRAALIVCTALVGTSLAVAGCLALASVLFPEYCQSALDSPRLLGGAGAGLLASSLLLQALLTRRSPARPATAPER